MTASRMMILAFALSAAVAWAASFPCDFNFDGICDCTDIDALVFEIAAGTNDPAFDLNGDGLVDLFDRDEWLVFAGMENTSCGDPYVLGDVNLDGVVDGVDQVIVETNFGTVGAYCDGDVNADGVVDGSDLIIVVGNIGMSSCPPIPVEPMSWGSIKTTYR